MLTAAVEQHEPEVARMVLPLEIDLRLGEQQREPGEREHRIPAHAHGRPVLRSVPRTSLAMLRGYSRP